ncbi:MAG: UDP-N-acetylglucosamine 2-epimerase, partial [Candidatus Bathyarchaeia archaeon]
VDDPLVLKNFMEAFMEAPIPIVYPVHPRTQKRLKQNRIYTKIKKSRNLQLLPPLGYLDFLMLMKKCEIILTDSGGIQEEATAPQIRKPVLVLRTSTERPEAVEVGFATVVGTEKQNILEAIKGTIDNQKELPTESPFGRGDAAEQIVKIIEENF